MTSNVRKVQLNCTQQEDRTKQSFRDECDMNKIVSRIHKSGFIPLEAQNSLRRQIYGDASAVPQSLEDAYAVVHRADAFFSSLPAALRERFVGASGLLEFIENPANLDEAVKLGLVQRAKPVVSTEGAAAPAAPAAPAATVVPEVTEVPAE